jgi:signal peptidase I
MGNDTSVGAVFRAMQIIKATFFDSDYIKRGKIHKDFKFDIDANLFKKHTVVVHLLPREKKNKFLKAVKDSLGDAVVIRPDEYDSNKYEVILAAYYNFWQEKIASLEAILSEIKMRFFYETDYDEDGGLRDLCLFEYEKSSFKTKGVYFKFGPIERYDELKEEIEDKCQGEVRVNAIFENVCAFVRVNYRNIPHKEDLLEEKYNNEFN